MSRHRMSCLLTLFLIIQALHSVIAHGDDDALNQRLRTECPNAIRNLEVFYKNIQLTEKVTGTIVKQNYPDRDGSIAYRFYSNGSSLRGSGLDADYDVLSGVVATEDGTFRVARTNATEEFVLTQLDDSDYETQIESLRLGGLKLPFVPYCVLNLRVVDLLVNNPHVISIECMEVTYDDVPAVHVDVRFEPLRGAKLILDPERSWALLKYEYGNFSESGSLRVAAIKYDRVVNGIPVVKSADYWRVDAGERRDMYHAEVADIELEPAPMAEFSLEAFGISPPQTVQRSNTPLWTVVLGILGLAIAMLLAYFVRRKPRTSI